MKKSEIKWAMTVICVLAAGVCYSCAGMNGRGDAAGGKTLVLTEETAFGESAEDTAGTEERQEDEGTDTPVAAEPEASCFVHICGEVAMPGVYELPAGSRIFEAVEMAGGFTEDAASSWLNLAQEIADGMKIVVPSEEELTAGAAGAQTLASGTPDGMAAPGGTLYGGGYGAYGMTEGVSPAGAGSGGKVNINTAGKEELMTLNGIGEARAEAVIRYREEHGPFLTIEDIMNVSGIKNAAFEKIRDDITV